MLGDDRGGRRLVPPQSIFGHAIRDRLHLKQCRAVVIGKMPDGSRARRIRPPQLGRPRSRPGVTPLEVMLDNMRSAYQRALELEKQLDDLPPEELEAGLQLMGEIARQRQIAQKCAADAANYVHPKLASIQHGEDPDHPLKGVTDAHRLQVIVAELLDKPELRHQVLRQLS
jgi:hypothetical protein